MWKKQQGYVIIVFHRLLGKSKVSSDWPISFRGQTQSPNASWINLWTRYDSRAHDISTIMVSATRALYLKYSTYALQLFI